MSITYVSSCFKLRDFYTTVKDTQLDDYIRFVKTGIPCILFLDKELSHWTERLKEFTNITVIADRTLEEFPTAKLFPREQTKLPETRNMEKDTYDFLILMNNKLDFLNEALTIAKTDTIGWVDFGISKIIKNDRETFYTRLHNVRVSDQRILLPGCTEQQDSVNVNHVHWRFCGGLFFGKKDVVKQFYEESKQVLTELAAQNQLTWEVNVWAMVEKRNQSLFEWYKADHNDSMVAYPIKGDRKIIVTLMIKNEEKIIKRCILNALAIADAICISDTGSTDGTVDLLKEFLPTLAIPTKLAHHEWQDFGHNRTLSFREAQTFCKELQWDSDRTYSLLLDADMNFVMKPNFTKEALTAEGYSIIQKNASLEYYNTRFIRVGHPWSCVGVTHEYWGGGSCNQLSTVYIDDIGDGGCKADKFIRDERLLRKGLEEDPTNGRYMFYLAQTLKDMGKLQDSIDYYKKRIEVGGWFEEIWYSMYMISKLYYELGNMPEMECWGLKAYEFNKNRSENIYFLTKIFREKGQNFKAWHYMKLGKAIKKPSDLLFLESAVYDHLFDYEKTILNYYVQHDNKKESLQDLVSHYNKVGGHCYSNLQYYVSPVKHRSIRNMTFPQMGDYIASSTSIIKLPEDRYRLNVRYVNYRVQPNGSYIMFENGVGSHDHLVRTRNFTVIANAKFEPVEDLREMNIVFPPRHNTRIKGLEDLRIYQDGDSVKWSAASIEYSHDCHIRQIMGVYNVDELILQNGVSMIPPKESDCEKNWIPLGNDEFIYSWHPYTVGKLLNSQFVPTMTQETPKFFEHYRGSSNVVEWSGSLYTLTHIVQYVMPRKYYHQLVRLNKDSRKVEAYTHPFYFKTNHIEYCLGIEIRDSTLFAIVSQNDANPILVEIAMDDLEFHGA
jgi:glycosyltransferase involved in cell wall biosynthesis